MPMSNVKFQEISSFIWNVCDDVLRGLFKAHEYGDVILPFITLFFNFEFALFRVQGFPFFHHKTNSQFTQVTLQLLWNSPDIWSINNISLVFFIIPFHCVHAFHELFAPGLFNCSSDQMFRIPKYLQWTHHVAAPTHQLDLLSYLILYGLCEWVLTNSQ